MRIAIITVAGVSSRFNEGLPEEKRQLKAIYSESGFKETLLYHLLEKCRFADVIVVVGGYKYDRLERYCSEVDQDINNKLVLVYNDHFEELGSGYSLYLGLEKAFEYNPEEVLFIEGDLDIDEESLNVVLDSKTSVLTYNHEPIYSNKAVVLYRNSENKYRYAFNSCHGLLLIDEPFSLILNSGQIWKFNDILKLRCANERFIDETPGETNLRIIQNYLDQDVEVCVIPIKHWTNCNTKSDFKKITSYWEAEK